MRKCTPLELLEYVLSLDESYDVISTSIEANNIYNNWENETALAIAKLQILRDNYNER